MTLHRVEVIVSFWVNGNRQEFEKRIYYIKARSRDLAEKKAKEIYLSDTLPNFVRVSYPEIIRPLKA